MSHRQVILRESKLHNLFRIAIINLLAKFFNFMNYKKFDLWLEKKTNRQLFFIGTTIVWGVMLCIISEAWMIFFMICSCWWLGNVSRRLYGRYAVKKGKDRQYWTSYGISATILTILTLIHPILGFFCILITGGILKSRFLRKEAIEDIGGGKLKDYERVKKEYDRVRVESDPGFYWGGIHLPSKEALTYFLVAGSVGSGKTITLRLLMQSMLPNIREGSEKRALIYDAKQDLVSLVAGMSLNTEILILNPFDARCVAWDMAKDIKTHEQVASFAEILVPKEEGAKEDPFFRDATIEILKALVEIYVDYASDQWTLRDVYLAMRSRKILEALLRDDPEHEHILDFFSDERTAGNIMATIQTKLGRYKTIAALWDRAERKISLTEWANSSSILVFGKDNEAEVSLNALNQLIFTRASQILLSKPESPNEPSTFIILDELPVMGKLKSLKELATTGRSKGISLAIGFQSIQDLEHTYGEQLAHTITGQFRHKAILRLDDAKTAKWASDLIGESEQLLRNRSTSVSSQLMSMPSVTEGGNEQFRRTATVMPSEIQDIPPINPQAGKGLTGYYIDISNYKYEYPPDSLFSQLTPPKSSVPDYLPIETHYQRLQPWGDTDYQRLSLEPTDFMPALEQSASLEEELPVLEPGDMEALQSQDMEYDEL